MFISQSHSLQLEQVKVLLRLTSWILFYFFWVSIQFTGSYVLNKVTLGHSWLTEVWTSDPEGINLWSGLSQSCFLPRSWYQYMVTLIYIGWILNWEALNHAWEDIRTESSRLQMKTQRYKMIRLNKSRHYEGTAFLLFFLGVFLFTFLVLIKDQFYSMPFGSMKYIFVLIITSLLSLRSFQWLTCLCNWMFSKTLNSPFTPWVARSLAHSRCPCFMNKWIEQYIFLILFLSPYLPSQPEHWWID